LLLGLWLFSFLLLIVAWSLFVVVDCCLVAPFFRGVVVVNLLLLVVAPVASLCFAAVYGIVLYTENLKKALFLFFDLVLFWT
jgi:hypothetical protein